VNGEWVLSRATTQAAMLLKDGNGRPIFEFAERPGDPDMICGKPVNQSEYAPSTFTTGQYVGLFGDLSYYHIVDQLTEIQRLDEKFAETSQTGFIARAYSDGMPTIEEAFSRLKLA
jgi:HK97 family phage major capsid protein